MLASAIEHYQRQQRITAAAVAEADKKPNPQALAATVTAYQLLAAKDAAAAVPQMLAEQQIADPPIGPVAITALAGVASDGLPLDSLFEQAADAYRLAVMVATQVQDAARNAAAVEIAARSRVGYVRMLNLPSCSRCILLAGAWYKWNTGFQRHPKCDCRHIPAIESDANDLTTNPQAAFESLSREQQDDIFGKAGAEAIRAGADVGQVVSARRGMRKAQLFGREVWATTEGTTSRGVAGQRLGAKRGKRAVRLMPETLMAIAEDRADAQRLLRLHGYIL